MRTDCGVDRVRRADQDVALPRSYTETAEFIGEAIRRDPEEPDRTGSEEALTPEEVLDLRERLLEL